MTSRQTQYLVGLLIVLLIGVGLVVLADTNRKKLAAQMEAQKASALLQADEAAKKPEEKQAGPESAEATPESATGKPSFDVARFEPTGDGVLAGLAKPGAIVELLADGEPISSTTANEVGEWVIILEKPLAAGSHDLAVRATVPEGEPALSEDFIAVVVPDSPSGEVLVVASRPGQASKILARPSTSDKPETAAKPDSAAGMVAGEAATAAPDQQAAAAGGEDAEGTAETQVAALEEQAASDAMPDKPADQADAGAGSVADSAPVTAATDENQETAAGAADAATAAAPEPEAAASAEAVAEANAGETEKAVATASRAPEAEAMEKPADAQSAASEMTDEASAESMETASAPVEAQSSEGVSSVAKSADVQSEQMAAADPAPGDAEVAAAPDAASAQFETAVSTMEKTSGPDMATPETSVAAADAPQAAAPANDQTASAASVEQQTAMAPAEPESEPVVEKPKRQFKLALDAVETEGSMVYAAGTGNPGALVRVYADDTFIGETAANDDGRWLLETSAEIAAGNVVVRADELAAGNADVIRRAEVPFFKQADAIALLPTTATAGGGASGAASGAVVTAPKSVIIRSGDNLWTISRRTYGRGIRYTTIYQANDDQIRNPHMIFPGQVFVLPEGDKTWTQ